MLYREKNPLTIEAYKFTGEVTEELRNIGIVAPNSFQLQSRCPNCGSSLHNHGLFGIGQQFQVICPNTYIIYNRNQGIQLMSATNFESLYRPLCSTIEDAAYEEVSNSSDEHLNA